MPTPGSIAATSRAKTREVSTISAATSHFGDLRACDGAGKYLQLAIATAQVVPALLMLGDIAEQSAEQGRMDALVVFLLRQRGAGCQPLLAAGDAELGVDIAPLAQAQERQEFALAQLAQLVLAQRLALLLVIAPEIEPGHEVRARMAKAGVHLVRLLLLVRRVARAGPVPPAHW